MGVITFVAAGTSANAASGNVSPGLPAGLAINDIMILIVSSLDNVAHTVAATTGTWTSLDAGTNNTTGLHTSVWWSRAVSGSTAPTVTHSSGSGIVAQIAAYRGCNGAGTTNSPVDVAITVLTNGTASTTATATGITPKQTNDCLLFLCGCATRQTSAPSGFSSVNGSTYGTANGYAPTSTASRPGNFIAGILNVGAFQSATGNATATIISSVSTSYLLSLGAAPVDDEDEDSFGGFWVPEVIAEGVNTAALSQLALQSRLGLGIITDPEMVPAGKLFGQDDEDFPWADVGRGPPFPVPPSNYVQLPVPAGPRDVEEIPAGKLFGQDDEDFFVPPLALAPPWSDTYRKNLPLILPDPEEIPAATLYGLSVDGSTPVTGTLSDSTANSLALTVSTAGPNRLLVVAVALCGDNSNAVFPVTVSGGGLTWTRQVSNIATGGQNNIVGTQIWTAFAATQLTGATITIANSNANHVECAADCIAFAGASQTVGVSGGVWSTASVAAQVSLGGVTQGSFLVGAFAEANAAATLAPISGTAFDQTLNSATAPCGLAVGRTTGLTPTPGTYTIGSASSNSFTSTSALEIRPQLPFGQPDEDFWDTRSRPLSPPWPVTAQNYLTLPAPAGVNDVEEISAGFLAGQDDEDFPSGDVGRAPPFPVPAQTLFAATQQWAPDVQEPGTLSGQDDEDFDWGGVGRGTPFPVVNATLFAATQQWVPDVQDIVAAATPTQQDEDFQWSDAGRGPPFPVTAATVFSATQQWLAETNDPAGALFGQPDEDFNPADVGRGAPLPVAAQTLFLATLQWLPDVQEPAGFLAGEPDEDFEWQDVGRGPPYPAQATTLFPATQRWLDDVQEPAGHLSGQDDEDFWLLGSPPFPLPLAFGPLYRPDPEELPAGALTGQPDEDFYVPELWAAPWPLPQLTAPAAIPQWAADVQEPAGRLSGQPDEDFWQLGPPYAVPRALRALYLPDPEEIPAGSLSVPHQPDEDFWALGPLPVQATLYQHLPMLDPDEVPAGFLSGQPDEDFWRLLSPPAPRARELRPLYLPDPEEIPAGRLAGQDDEDYWPQAQLPAPVPMSFRQPYVPDPEELPAADLAGQNDEDFWSLGPAPTQASVYQPLPYLPDEEQPITVSPPVLEGGDAPLVPAPVQATTSWASVNQWYAETFDLYLPAPSAPPAAGQTGASTSGLVQAIVSQSFGSVSTQVSPNPSQANQTNASGSVAGNTGGPTRSS